MVFDGLEMIRMATLPGMWERTITIGSAGKTFSVTGWKLGWAVGPSNLIFNCQVLLDIHAKYPATQIGPLRTPLGPDLEGLLEQNHTSHSIIHLR